MAYLNSLSFLVSLRRKLLVLILLISSFSVLSAQDTVRIMNYNLLLYGGTQTGCSPLSTSQKNPFISTVIENIKPDIFCANEVGPNTLHFQNLLINVLQPINGAWMATDYKNPSNSSLVNTLFYNSDKFGLLEHKTINFNIRDSQFYRLYYKDPNLSAGSDTVFFSIVVTHLKAGNSSSDQLSRDGQTQGIMNYLDNLGRNDNFIVLGDFNVYSSSEDCYQNMVNFSNPFVRMHDPISRPGNWSSNSSFADIHTQSTRTSSNDCGSGGGMDDRFDQILVSDAVMNGTLGAAYISNSYKAWGNDGQHYNKAINGTPTNTFGSANLINALAAVSDHLPVVMDMSVDRLPVAIAPSLENNYEVLAVNHPFSDEAVFQFSGEEILFETLEWQVTDLTGRILLEGIPQPGTQGKALRFSVANWQNGIYFLRMKSPEGSVLVKKFMKSKY